MSSVLKMAKEMKVEVDQGTVTVNATVPLSLFEELLNQFERFDQQMRMDRRRNRIIRDLQIMDHRRHPF